MLPFRRASPSKAAAKSAEPDDLRRALVHCLDLLTKLASTTDLPVEAKVRLRRLKMAANSARGAIEMEAVGVDICGLTLPAPPAAADDTPSVDAIVAGAAHAAEEVADAAAVPGLSSELRRLAAMPAPSPLPVALEEFSTEMDKLRDVVRFLRERGDIMSSAAAGMADHLGSLTESDEESLGRLEASKASISSAVTIDDLHSARNELLAGVESLIDGAQSRIAECEATRDLLRMHETHKTLLESALANAKEMAKGDALTGLGNRRALDGMVRAAAGEAGIVGVVVISIDGLADTRDRLGRETTGALLQQFAARLKGELYSEAGAFRLDGDTFVLMLPGRDLGAAKSIGEGLLSRAAAPLRVLGKDHLLKLSIGVSVWKAGKAFRAVLDKADALRAQVRKGGGNGVKAKAA